MKWKIRPLEQLVRIAEAYKRERLVVVTINGCFDILHPGHVRALEESSECGDILIAGIDSDEAIKRRGKGPGRPVNNQNYRAEMIASIMWVDYVTIYDFDNSGPFVAAIKPDIHANGPENGEPEKWVEYPEIVKCGAKAFTFTRYKDEKEEPYSTTRIIERLKNV